MPVEKFLDSKTLLFQIRELLQNDLVKFITFLDLQCSSCKTLCHGSLSLLTPSYDLVLHLGWQAWTPSARTSAQLSSWLLHGEGNCSRGRGSA